MEKLWIPLRVKRGLYQIAVRLDPVTLPSFEIDSKGLDLLLHEGNDPMKTQHISVIEFPRGLVFLG